MFSRERCHIQLVQRAEELLKLLIGQDSLTEDELEMIWTTAHVDETTRLELYKLFNELSSRLKLPEINFVLDRLSAVPLPKLMIEQI